MGLQSLDISKRLSAEGIEPRQAEAIASAIVLAADGSSDSLATKQDLAATRGELKRDIAELRTELKRDIGELRTELKHDIEELRAEMKSGLDLVRSDLRGEMSTLKSDMQLLVEKSRNQMIFSTAGIVSLVVLIDRLLG